MNQSGKVLVLIPEKKEVIFFHNFFREYFPEVRLLYPPPGEDILSASLQEQPELIILDLFTTGIHGLELCKQLKAEAKLKTIPILTVTPKKAGSDLKVQALEAGADLHLIHPTNPKELHAKLKLLFRLKALEDMNASDKENLYRQVKQSAMHLEAVRTEQMLAEENVQIEREFARQVMNVMGQGLTVTNSEVRFQYVNKAYADMLGYSTEEMLGRQPREFTHPDDIHLLETAWTLRDAGESNTYEIRQVSKAGQLVPVMVSGVPYFRGGRIAGTIAVVTNITELKAKEAELTRLSEDYERVFNGSREALFLVEVFEEKVFRFARTNPIHQKLSGIPLEEIVGKTPRELLGEKLGAQVHDNYMRCIANREVIVYEEEMHLPGGNRWWETSLTPVTDNGRVVYIVGSSTEITRYKELEHKLSKINSPSFGEGPWGG
jgi:PAS domain S-box-containing protein